MAGVREKVRIIVGGAPVTQEFANKIGADGYAYDAPGAAKKCKEWNQ
jgi:5-methyltetrahydrofolate--homocysteine methyltransferase